MRAAAVSEPGPWYNISIRNLPIPSPGPGQVLIRSDFSAVNHVDTFVRAGTYPTPLPLPFVVGRDVVGTVEAVGAGDCEFAEGDRAWSCGAGHRGIQGPTAEYVAVPVARVYRAPRAADPLKLVGLAHAATTAHLALFRHGHVAPGQSVAVFGAGSQVGRSLVSLATLAGAHVAAICHPRHHDELSPKCALGVGDSGDRDSVRQVLGQARPHLVVDASGAPDLGTATDAMRPGGRLVLLAGRNSRCEVPLGNIYQKRLTVTGFTISDTDDEPLGNAAQAVSSLLPGLPEPRPRILPLADTADAHRIQESGLCAGEKLIIDIHS